MTRPAGNHACRDAPRKPEIKFFFKYRISFLFFFGCFKTYFCVALIFLELNYVDQTGFKSTEICLPLPPEYRIKGMSHHTQLFYNSELYYVLKLSF